MRSNIGRTARMRNRGKQMIYKSKGVGTKRGLAEEKKKLPLDVRKEEGQAERHEEEGSCNVANRLPR